jgi:trehalose utilization protein
MTIRARVWNENVHERKNPHVVENYLPRIHGQGCRAARRRLDYRVDRERRARLTHHPKSA